MTAERGYARIVEALERGRKALLRARLTAGLLRFAGITLATAAALVLWAALQRALHLYSVPVATAASVIGAGVLLFALVRWVVVPLVRMPGRDDFVRIVEERHPEEHNVIVNAYQLGEAQSRGKHASAGDLIDALVDRAAARVESVDLKTWRDPAPDRPYLWAGGAAVVLVAALALVSPALLKGAVGQVVRPGEAQAPPVTLAVDPQGVEIERGDDVDIRVDVTGTGEVPALEFRERSGEWRTRAFTPASSDAVTRDGGAWTARLTDVDRYLEYRVSAPRAQSEVYAIRVQEAPRVTGYRMHLRYPDYTGLPAETVDAGAGDVAAIAGTRVDLRILTNRELSSAVLTWQDDEGESRLIDLEPRDDRSWGTEIELLHSGTYTVGFTDADGRSLIRTPRYRMEAVPDRAPYLTLHLPQEDHDLYEDLMERVVADAADDFGFSLVRVAYRIDDGPEQYSEFQPYTAGQKEFRLDTLWDLGGLNLLPGQTLAFYLQVRDNDTVTGPKEVRSEVRRVRFPTVAEMYEEVAEDHDREIGNLSDVQKEQAELRERLERMSDDLKQGKDLNWELQQEMKNSLAQQQQLEQQLDQVAQRLEETMEKASDRANMNRDLVQKMSELNELLETMANEDMKRAFQQLSAALAQMNPNEIREALEDFQENQEQMLAGIDRTIELLKQIRKEEQVEDVVQRTDEIAQLQEQIAEELEKLGGTPPPAEDPAAGAEDGETPEGETPEGEAPDAESPEDGAPTDGANPPGEPPDGEPKDGEPTDGAEESPENGSAESPEGERSESEAGQQGEPGGEMTPEMKELLEELEQVKEELRAEADKYRERREEERKNRDGSSGAQGEAQQQESERRQQELQERMDQLREALAERQKEQEQQKQQGSQGQQQEGQKQQGEQQAGNQQQPQGEPQQGQQQQQQQQAGGKEKEKLDELAKQQERVQELVEELKRQLEMLRKLNEEDQALAQDLEEMESGESTQNMEQSMQGAQQSMSGGQKQESTKYAFRARDEAQRLAEQAEEMQQQMQQRQEDNTVAQMERIIQGLIDVSRVVERLFQDPSTDERELAARQYALGEKAQAMSDSLVALSRQTFAVNNDQSSKLSGAIRRMEQATRYYELGNLRSARHEGRESTGDLNETIVELMQSHSQMCQGGGSGSQMQQLMDKMQGLSEAQQQLNEQAGGLAEGAQGQKRLSMTQRQRLEWLAAQQQMIREGLDEVQREFGESEELLGDLDALGQDMVDVEERMRSHELSERLLERQQKILSRLLDAQRSVRQQEMSPQRESRTATLAERTPPPPIPDHLLRPDRSLEEDVLRGADDRYPVQYRRLVEDYFKALARENRTP